MNDLPKTLYKYVTPDRVDILERLKIRFTPPLALNDPFDIYPTIEGIDERNLWAKVPDFLKKWHQESVLRGEGLSYKKWVRIHKKELTQKWEKLKQNGPLQQKQRREISINAFNKIGILCLSAEDKNLLMWAHYTDSHRGFVISFDPKHPFFGGVTETPSSKTISPVAYSKERPAIKIGAGTTGDAVFRTKSKWWAYEKEWRAFRTLKDCDETIGNDVHLFDLPGDAIQEVILGVRIDTKKKERILSIIGANSKLKHIKVRESQLHPHKFELLHE